MVLRTQGGVCDDYVSNNQGIPQPEFYENHKVSLSLMISRKICDKNDRTRNEDIPELLAMAEDVGWRIEDDGAGQYTLRSPLGKHGDWATVQIRINPGGRQHVWTLTRHQYHKPRQGDRGLRAALRALHPDEQWRYQSEFPKNPLPK